MGDPPADVPTPYIAHLTAQDYEHVYEPAEDSFILLDALEADAALIRAGLPSICVEIGSGSGVVSAFVGMLLGYSPLIIATDINPHANVATLRTSQANHVVADAVNCDLLTPLSRLVGKVDLLCFNPPYVATEEEEMHETQATRGIGGAWAGGQAGMDVTGRLLEQVHTLLAPGGAFYLVAVIQNHPQRIVDQLNKNGLSAEIVLRRRAGREHLHIIRAHASS